MAAAATTPSSIAAAMAAFQQPPSSASLQHSTSPWRTRAPASSLQPGYGAKRRAACPLDDDPDAAQRLAKRFHLLNIENGNRLWVDPNNVPAPEAQASPAAQLQAQSQTHISDNWRSRSPAAAHAADELMQVEDTRERVFVHDLDAELADADRTDAEEERLVFLPDIERRLNAAPLRLLFGMEEDGTQTSWRSGQSRDNEDDGDGGAPDESGAMVLYGLPRALSAPDQSDSVRRAIVESRARARGEIQRASRDAMLHGEGAVICETAPAGNGGLDEDAMDIG